MRDTLGCKTVINTLSVNGLHHSTAAEGYFLALLDIHVLVADLAEIGAVFLQISQR
jgi:hypothetical protein